MSELGSIFEAAAEAGSGPRGPKGPDVRVQAEVRRSALGQPVTIAVPDAVPHEGATVPRSRGPDDPPGGVRLHLSPQLAQQDKTTLRLRGQGGEHPESGRAGDLYVELTIVRGAAWRWWVLVAVLAAIVTAVLATR